MRIHAQACVGRGGDTFVLSTPANGQAVRESHALGWVRERENGRLATVMAELSRVYVRSAGGAKHLSRSSVSDLMPFEKRPPG